MRYADAEALFRWVDRRFLPWDAYDMTRRLSVEGTPDRLVPPALRKALTEVRHRTQLGRLRMVERYWARRH